MERFRTQHATLLRERAQLVTLIAGRKASAVSHGSASVQDAFPNSGDSEFGDAATEAFDQTLDMTMLEKYRTRLQAIDAALGRFEAGRYGRCIRCQQAIGTPRLDAIPETAYCLACERSVEVQA